MKRVTLAYLIAIAGAALSCFQTSAQDKIRVGLSSVSALHGALWVAEQKAIFKKYGIEAEVIVVGGAGRQRAFVRRYSIRQCGRRRDR
jgi:ABC-type nitrate/sulfonate/bicarbonate transport system substrate-binding protein